MERQRQTALEEAWKSIELTKDFPMAPSEFAKAEAWMAEHRGKHGLPTGTINGQYWAKFTRLSVADVVEIGCRTCGESIDVTDIETW